MPRTSEIAFNVTLSNVLRTKHPRWHDRTSAEQKSILRETALQPDVVIRPPGGIPVVLETEFEPAHSVEEDAQKRLGKFLQYKGAQIEQTIAVQIPQDLSEVPQEDLEREIEAAEFRIASDLLLPIPDGTANAVLNLLAQAASDLAGLGATTLHDLSGRMFQRLIADRKFLATFYTLPTSAALLGGGSFGRGDGLV